jgi:hypothetical protein
MKYIVLVLSIIVSLVSSGCTGVPSAGVYVTNNVADTSMVIESTRGGVLNPRIKTGDKAFVPVSGFPPGNEYVVSAKVYALDGTYLGIAEQHEWISFDSSGRYGRTWVVSSYRAIAPKQWSPRTSGATSPVSVVKTPPAPGSLQVLNNMKDVEIVLSSSEDPQRTYPPLNTGLTAIIPIGIDPTTREFVITAKIQSLKGEYLGVTEFRGSINEQQGFGNGRSWKINSYIPVERSYAKDDSKR